ncbi:hypothetical protein [Nocardiopsis tropica]|uniref:Uncharacterized protein n=1 Tax=Nocardiopsis tropica TaxID=109330 RepID=A0ABV2A4K3_9ACTN
MLVGVELLPSSGSDLGSGSFDIYTVPHEWRSYDEETQEDEPLPGQLVVCLTGVHQREFTPMGTGEWDFGESPVYPATHSFRVYEARTGEAVATFVIDSDLDAYSSCPSALRIPIDSGTPGMAQGVKSETFAAELEPHVMADLG